MSPEPESAEGCSDEPVMAERIGNPTLTETVRLIVHREHLSRACSQSLSGRFVRIGDNQAHADARPTERLGAEIEGVRVFIDDEELEAVNEHLSDNLTGGGLES